MKKLLTPIILTVILSAVFIALLLPNITFIPFPKASAESLVVDSMLSIEMAFIGAIFILCMVFFFYSIVVWRRKADTDMGEPIHGNTPLEIVWTLIPLVIVIGFSVWGTDRLNFITNDDNVDLVVEVHARQWSWSFYYPETEIESADLILPVNQKIQFEISSDDVIHSFWVPEFRLKQDAVPGRVTTLIITPTETGKFRVRCAELCGLQHAFMLANVEVMSSANYDAWVTANSVLSDDPVERGAVYAAQKGCIACHSIDGTTIVGPTWLHLFGEEVTLADGSTVTADEDYLLESILDPSAQVVEGFADGIMPQDFDEKLTEQEISDLIAYIISLGDE